MINVDILPAVPPVLQQGHVAAYAAVQTLHVEESAKRMDCNNDNKDNSVNK